MCGVEVGSAATTADRQALRLFTQWTKVPLLMILEDNLAPFGYTRLSRDQVRAEYV